MGTKILLNEAIVVRVIAISFLVVLHAFTIYGGGWPLPEGGEPIRIYGEFAHWVSGFMIPAMIMVSGYVFSYQILALKRVYSLKELVKIKFRRLIIPSIVFGSIYYFLFLFEPATFRLGCFIVDLLSGIGYMWFLPMLFWYFIGIWLIERSHISDGWGWVACPFGQFVRAGHSVWYI